MVKSPNALQLSATSPIVKPGKKKSVHVPGSVLKLSSNGQEITGASLSNTETVKAHATVFPESSVKVKVTVFSPNWKIVPPGTTPVPVVVLASANTTSYSNTSSGQLSRTNDGSVKFSVDGHAQSLSALTVISG